MEKQNKYKAGKPRFSQYHGYEIVPILRKGKILWIIPFWYYDHHVQNFGQADEIVFLLNNPNIMKQRMQEVVQTL